MTNINKKGSFAFGYETNADSDGIFFSGDRGLYLNYDINTDNGTDFNLLSIKSVDQIYKLNNINITQCKCTIRCKDCVCDCHENNSEFCPLQYEFLKINGGRAVIKSKSVDKKDRLDLRIMASGLPVQKFSSMLFIRKQYISKNDLKCLVNFIQQYKNLKSEAVR